MFKQLNFFFILILPLVFKYIFLFFFIDLELFDLEDILEDIFFFFAIILLFQSKIFKKQFFADALYVIYIFYFILETTSYIAVLSNFSSSYMYLLIESNNAELNEFMSTYINIPILLFIALMSFLFIIIRKKRFVIKKIKKPIIEVLSFFAIVIFLKFTGLIESNAYHNIVRGTYGYFQLQKSVNLKTEISKKNIQINANNEVLVVVLGESTARGHMQLYGYKRETTPLLNAIKDSLFIYNNVISTDVFTLKVIPKMLTSLDNTNTNKEVINIIEVFNKAGYNTFWLSNQRPISFHDNAISKIASASNKFKFFNHIIDKHTVVLDEIILPDYKNILDQEGKKVIFIRLIGTHFDYKKRYPKAYIKFVSELEDTTDKDKTINHYDNAVLYNDFIVYSILQDLKKTNTKSALLYLSDHGENVYDDGDFFGRTESNLKKNMFDIPFFIWTSNEFEFPDDFEYMPNRKFMTDHLYESLGHLFGVMHKDMNANHSIFSKFFKKRKRIVVNDINYDEHFLTKDE
jgi:heptose-I-phosphate ethanolaminephosphotransferase